MVIIMAAASFPENVFAGELSENRSAESIAEEQSDVSENIAVYDEEKYASLNDDIFSVQPYTDVSYGEEEEEDSLEETEYLASGTVGDISWSIDETGYLYVEGTGDLKQIPWGVDATLMNSIKTAKIKLSGCTSLWNLFYACVNLESADLSETDVSSVTSLQNLFCGCKSLKTVNLTSWDTSAVTNMSRMFEDCRAIESIDVSGFDTSSVTTMRQMFYECRGLQTLDVSGFDTAAVTDMNSVFNGCRKLETIDVSKWSTSSVADMSCMFKDCNVVTTLDVSKFDTTNVKNMCYMFYGCKKLQELDVSKFVTKNVTDMKYMFYDCAALTSLDVSGFSTSAVTSMSFMFYNCKQLEIIDVSGFLTSNVTDMAGMFEDCVAATEIDVSGFDTSAVKDMSDMFWNCNSVVVLDVAKWKTPNVTGMSHMFANCNAVSNLDVSGFDTSNVKMTSEMFMHCKKVNSLSVNGFDMSNVISMSGMFLGCESLKEIDISAWNTKTATHMDDLFSWCTSLESMDISHLDTSSVINMGAMFAGCTSLKNVKMTGMKNGKLKYMTSMFSNCASLESIDLTGFNTSTVTNMGGMFGSCSSLKSIDLSVIDLSNVTGMSGMFRMCPSLENVDISGLVATKDTNLTDLFRYSPAIKTLTMNGADLSELSPSMAFELNECVALEKIVAPVNVAIDIKLPGGGQWTDTAGNVYTSLPQGKTESIVITREMAEAHTITYMNCENANNPNPTSYYEGIGLYLQQASKPGYLFNYWYTKNGSEIAKISSIPASAKKDYVIYASWTKYKYIVVFDSNESMIKDYYGGTKPPVVSGRMSDQTVNVEKATDLNKNNYKIKGYKFVGWNTRLDGSGKWYADGAQYTVGESDPTIVFLYAQWEKETYTITYKGFSEEEVAAWNLPTAYQIDAEPISFANINLSGNGFKVKGLYSDKNYKKKITKIDRGSTGNKVIYPKIEGIKYKLVFDRNESSIDDYKGKSLKCSGKIKDQSLTYKKAANISANKYKITGYNFIGWNTAADGSGDTYTDKQEVLNLTTEDGARIKLYARWEKATYSISYSGITDEEAAAWNLPVSYQVDSDMITFADYNKNVSRTGYVFKGWYSDKKFKNKIVNIKKGSTGNKVVYPKMTANKYKLSFKINDESINDFNGQKLKKSGKMKNQTLTYDKTANISANKFKITGYIFAGWNTEADGSGIPYTDKMEVTNLTVENGTTITLYALWKKAVYDIVYVGITPEEAESFGLPTDYRVDSATITFADYTDKIDKEGYTFKGWFSDKKFKKSLKKISTGSTGNKTVYLKFKKK